jgi:hypothetical protein
MDEIKETENKRLNGEKSDLIMVVTTEFERAVFFKNQLLSVVPVDEILCE